MLSATQVTDMENAGFVNEVDDLSPNNLSTNMATVSGQPANGVTSGNHSPSASIKQSPGGSTKNEIAPDRTKPKPEVGDGFPWNSRRVSSANVEPAPDAVIAIEASPGKSRDRMSRRRRFLLWWRNMVRTLQDNRVQSEETLQKLILLDRMQETHFRLVKRMMNVVFLTLGMILLLAVIVLIVYTDPRFEESMKALTVFMAGRREGLW